MATAGVVGALIGLLFVAISVAQDGFRARWRRVGRRGQRETAYIP